MQREDVIATLISGKRVLDIGSLGQSSEYCLWRVLERHTASLTGVDLPSADATARNLLHVDADGLRHKGDPRIVYGNMETLDLGQTFQVVVAGDVIEHVSNQGLFLDNIYRHLEPGGCLVLTTPNAKWPTVNFKPNLTHVLWHDVFTLRQLLERHGFTVDTIKFYRGNKPHYPFWLRPLLARQQILAIARKPNP